MSRPYWALITVMLTGLTALAQTSQPAPKEVELSLKAAMEMASSSEQSFSAQRGQDIVRFANSGYVGARARLLPFLDGAVTEQNQTVNLHALGLRFQPTPGITFPESVGPYSTFDARIRMTQNVLNLSAIRSVQAARQDVNAAKAESATIRDREAAHVARLYAAALRAESEVEAAKADLDLSNALHDLASRKTSVGEGTEIEVARTAIALARHRQRLISAQSELRQVELELINALNLSWDTRLVLTDKLGVSQEVISGIAEAVATALQFRSDLQHQEELTASAKLRNTAAKMERVPSVVAFGEYGYLSGVPTHVVGVTLRIPLFDGERDADRAQAFSVMRQEEITEQELKRRIEMEIRKSMDELAAKQQEVTVTEVAVSFAQEVIAGARRQYAAGVTNSIEVTDAQTQLEKAEDDRVTALFDYANARIDFAEATGTIMQLSF
jgi:outer membrane protein TolC